MVMGVAVKLLITGRLGEVFTVTVAVAVLDPVVLVAVSVYVVVALGLTLWLVPLTVLIP
jgi:hypothetical protein